MRRVSKHSQPLSLVGILLFAAGIFAVRVTNAAPPAPFRIDIVDKESGWPVPMVELTTTHSVKFVSDNAGRVAFDLPELMGVETWLDVVADGYEMPADGFGKRGVRIMPVGGKSQTVEVVRTSIAKRLGRITGAGLFAESQKLGLERNWRESGIVGSDSVQNAVHNGKLHWSWGDTSIARYPLGIFHSTGATTPIKPLTKFEPPLRLKLDYFVDEKKQPRGIAKMPGKGPTWLAGYANLPDKAGKERLVASYVKVEPPMEVYETGLCVWNDTTEEFEQVRTLWTRSEGEKKHPPLPQGHSVIVDEPSGMKVALFGNPLPALSCPATFEAWQNPSKWEILKPQEKFTSATDGEPVKPSAGSIAWNEYRKRWVTVFHEFFGKPSGFGEVWYAEADSPQGPWGPAVKVLSHRNYSYYNPALHPEFTPADSPILLFEGTHSTMFANRPEPTPRYEYNQILYRLDLDDPKLAPARESARAAKE
jgi:hypothetical protein